jgi:hypothetical protein
LKKEHRLKVLETKLLRKIFGSERDEVRGNRRKLRNRELYDLYCSPNIFPVVKFRRMRWAGHIACMGKWRGAYRVLVGRPEGKRQLGRPSCTWEDNINMCHQEAGWEHEMDLFVSE